MSKAAYLPALFVVFWTALPSPAQTALAIVDEVEWPALQAHSRRLRLALHALHSPLPDGTEQELQALLEGGATRPNAAPEKVQQLLDAQCLVGVTINPESRVKAARGPAKAELRQDADTYLLVKVVNEAGVTHPLTVSGTTGGEWLKATVHAAPPLKRALSGGKLEYVVLWLRPREAGKREATLKFDVGQGTQDLGFRAEVPILFTVRPKR
jgi:hypothetical protein